MLSATFLVKRFQGMVAPERHDGFLIAREVGPLEAWNYRDVIGCMSVGAASAAITLYIR